MSNHPTLDVNLSAIAANYRLLKTRHAKHSTAAVVKADAYGLGMEAVSQRLWEEGCHEFFVATLAEAIALRGTLPDAKIGVFNGLLAGEEKDFAHYHLIPVLNDLEQVERFQELATQAILHIDTGMTRLGLSEADLQNILHTSSALYPLIMSHLACAGAPDHPKNAEQLARFRKALQRFPGAKASLANSSGLFLSPDFHFDLARPGCALYGINPTHGTNPMQPVVSLSAPLLQIRALDCNETVGYDATHQAVTNSRIAVAALGYADGWMRSLSNKGHAYIAGYQVPIIGIISMDMLALDITHIPEAVLTPTVRVEFINEQQTVNDVANACGTIGYEIFTRIGNRVKRRYAN